MIGTIMKPARRKGRNAMRALPGAFLLLMVCLAAPAGAYMDKENPLFQCTRNIIVIVLVPHAALNCVFSVHNIKIPFLTCKINMIVTPNETAPSTITMKIKRV